MADPTPEKNPPAPPAPPVEASPASTTLAPAIDVGELTAPLAAAMPPSTVSSPGELPGIPPAIETPGLFDSHKTRFNPDKHAVDANGKPLKNSKGNFFSKNIGKYPRHDKRAVAAQPAAPTPIRAAPTFANIPGGGIHRTDAPVPVAPPLPAGPDHAELMAEAYLQMTYAPLVGMLSHEIKPNVDEHAALKMSLAAALRTLKHIPEPNVWLVFGSVAYGVFAPKLHNPTVANRWGLAVLRMKQIFAKLSRKETPTIPRK